jgi:hypothetical protein
MSFSVIAIPPALTVEEKVVLASSSVEDNTSDVFVMMDNTKTNLVHRTIDITRNNAELYLLSNATTFVPTTSNTYETLSVVGMVFNSAESSSIFTSPSTGVIAYSGPSGKRFRVDVKTSAFIAGGTKNVGLRIVVNGGALNASYAEATLRTAQNGTEVISMTCYTTLNTSDTINIECANLDDTSAITFKHLNFSLESV